MATNSNLDQISKDLGEAVQRIEKLQAAEKPPLAQRLSSHLKKHGNNLTSLVLACCLFFVALGRLDLKNSLQVRLQQCGRCMTLGAIHAAQSDDLNE